MCAGNPATQAGVPVRSGSRWATLEIHPEVLLLCDFTSYILHLARVIDALCSCVLQEFQEQAAANEPADFSLDPNAPGLGS